MKFLLNERYLDRHKKIDEDIDFVLEQNFWDDFGYKTMFEAYIPSVDTRLPKRIGSLSIANITGANEYEETLLESKDSEKILKGYNAYEDLDSILGNKFNNLSECMCCLGTEEFYRNLNEILDSQEVNFTRNEIMSALNDIAYNPTLFQRYKNEKVIKTSFLRGLSPNHVTGTLNRLSTGSKKQIEYSFSVNYYEAQELTSYNFATNPEDLIPTNIHAIIGNNGSGKTRFLKDMIKAITANGKKVESEFSKNGNIFVDYTFDVIKNNNFSGIMFISFSPFDDISSILEFDEQETELDNTFRLKYVGILDMIKNSNLESQSIYNWEYKIREGLNIIKKHSDKTKLFWKQTEYLDFIQKKILPIKNQGKNNWKKLKRQERNKAFDKLIDEFESMSSGEKIVTLGLVSLVAFVEEETLVLFDEPELYLHPPLVSNYIRIISEIMSEKNGLAILVTHSPIILQEVSNDCIYIAKVDERLNLRRTQKPTFGENVSILTNGVFGLDIEKSGFYVYLKNFFENNKMTNKNKIIKLDNMKELGSEARFYLNILMDNDFDEL